jgi:cytochrome c-type biogenesis protein CcmH/NrfG
MLAGVGIAIAFLFVMHAGNTALASSASALLRGDAAEAAREARSARRWLPWSFEPWQRLAEAQLVAGDVDEARSSYRAAIERDPANWSLWYGLAAASDGEQRRRALDRVLELNPRSEEVDELRAEG